jgi:Pyridoxamine 5'-phosphate oxidase
VVFIHRALPEIRLVNHILDDGLIIVRTRLVTRLAMTVRHQLPYPTVVAYQVDELDPATRTGWSVFATGVARPVTEPERVARYERLLEPWVDQPMDSVFAIEPQFIVGFRLEDAGDP